jgi:bifunctional non-homologous end joining protein LigD
MSAIGNQDDTYMVGGRRVPFPHLDKTLFTGPDVTKRELGQHYERVAPFMLPYVRDRPLSLQGFPPSSGDKGYYIKEEPSYFPDWIATTVVPKKDGTVTQVLGQNAATFVYLAGQDIITTHAWLSRADQPHSPDRLIFDFDPAEGISFSDIRAAAREAGARLQEAGLTTYAMLTGSRGIHVIAPLRRGHSFEEVYAFGHAIAEAMVADSPESFTLEFRKNKRGQRIFLDIGRNRYAQTAVVPYSVRKRPAAPVATPLRWDELEDANLKADSWTVKTIQERLGAGGDPWKGMASHARALPGLPA